MTKENTTRVLLIAESANPEWTSVPLVGWSHSYALSKVCNTHLVTQIRNREAILRFGWTEGEEFTSIDSEAIAAPFYKFATFLRGGDKLAWTIDTALQSIAYPYFECLCWRMFRSELRAGNFDLVHRITPLTPTAPSYLAKKLADIDVPFVIGPLNGGVSWPEEFKNLRTKEREWLSAVRNVYKLLPGYRATRKRSTAIIAGSKATMQQLPQHTLEKTFYIPENAVDPERFRSRGRTISALPIRAVFVGRLVPYKGADIAIEAISDLARKKKIEYDIFGSGPEEQSLKKLVEENNLQESVRIHGFVDHAELQSKLINADLLIFPSIREFGGGVVLEAMAMGIVPIVVDYAGPGEIVTDHSGYRVKMGVRSILIMNLRKIVEEICGNPGQLLEKSQCCVNRVEDLYTWEKKALQVLQIYQWALGSKDKPDFSNAFLEENSDCGDS